jgi:hypothetical protein
MGHIKMKNLLAENMRRFKTKNLNEAILSDTFYIFYETDPTFSAMEFSYKMPQSTVLKDPVDDYGSTQPTRDSIVFELLKYNEKHKIDTAKHTNLDDYMSRIDGWYTALRDIAIKAGLPFNFDFDFDFDREGDEWKKNLENNPENEIKKNPDGSFYIKQLRSDTKITQTMTLNNGMIVDITFIKGKWTKYDGEAIYKCVVKGAKSSANQSMN